MRLTRHHKTSQAEVDTEAVAQTQAEVHTQAEVVIKTRAHAQTFSQMSSNKLRETRRRCWARETAT